MNKIRKDTFAKDILILLIVGVVCSALVATGFALTTDKYFAKAVTGIMGDFGQYDLLFQTREELKGAMARQLQEIIDENFPGAVLKSGISVVGKSTFFLTLPSQYKNKTVFNNLGHYFDNLPGSGGYSMMTEPRINIASVPAGVFDLLSKQVETIPGVDFTFNDGGSIGIILKNARDSERVTARIKTILKKYQILEVRLTATYAPEAILTMSKQVSQKLLGIKGLDYAKDITMDSGTDDYQYMVNTLLQVKRFLMAYAAEVKIEPQPGQRLEEGDLLVANGQNAKDIKPGSLLEPLEVVIKVIGKDANGIRGLIIQGDAGYIRDNIAYQVSAGDKIGGPIGKITVSNRKAQLVYAMDQGVKLLNQLNGAIADFNNTTGGPGLTVNGVEKAYRRLAEVKGSLDSIENSVTGLTGRVKPENLTRIVQLINGTADDLDYLARTFARVQVLENRFDQVLTGMQGAQLLVGTPLMAASSSGGFSDKMQQLDSQLNTVESTLRSKVRQLDDFINRFNPLVATLLSWRNKARDFSQEINNFSTAFTPGSSNHQKLIGLIHSTDQVVSNFTGVNLEGIKSGLNIAGTHLFGTDKIDLTALIAEIEKMRDSLPKLLDEEIGHSVALIDKYAGDETSTGQKIQIFTRADIDRTLVDAAIRDTVNNSQAGIFSLPVGTIQPDIRGELFKILAEVRSTIAALVVMILWVLSFILDHSLMVSILRMMEFSFLPKRVKCKNAWLDWGYRAIFKVLSPANLYAAVVGGIWLSLTLFLANARIPYVNFTVITLIGAVLGVTISSLAEKINPISKDEVMAGLSLGLPFKTIMREIVIPAGRPGLMQFLNRWKMVMK